MLTQFSELADLVRDLRWSVADVTGERAGSGFFLRRAHATEAPVLVTNAHVVGNHVTLDVRTYSDEIVRPSRIVSAPEVDLAVAWFDDGFPPEAIGEGLVLRPLERVRLGEPVVAIGSPYRMEGTVTSGVVAGLDRVRDASQGTGPWLENAIVTDALIGPGNSGGPLLGLDRAVVGVAAAHHVERDGQDPSGLGYAIPAGTVEILLEDIRRYGGLFRGRLGIQTEMREPTARERAELGYQDGECVVVVVEDPQPGEPAAGLVHRGDIVLMLDDVRITSTGRIFALLDGERCERQCELVVLRRDQEPGRQHREPETIILRPRVIARPDSG